MRGRQKGRGGLNAGPGELAVLRHPSSRTTHFIISFLYKDADEGELTAPLMAGVLSMFRATVERCSISTNFYTAGKKAVLPCRELTESMTFAVGGARSDAPRCKTKNSLYNNP